MAWLDCDLVRVVIDRLHGLPEAGQRSVDVVFESFKITLATRRHTHGQLTC